MLFYKVISTRLEKNLDETTVIQYIAKKSGDPVLLENEKKVLQALSAIFGIDSPNDEERHRIVREKILPLLLKAKNADKLEKVIQIISQYCKWSASGAHRFAPLAMAVYNMINIRNIFSTEDLPLGIRDYMLNENPFYANPNNVPSEYLPSYMPELKLPVYLDGPNKWLDIGSAPKKSGSPTLNILRDILPDVFKYYGVDIAMPYFDIVDGEIVESEYVKNCGSNGIVVIGGVNYLNGRKEEFSVLDDGFLPGKRFKFISICMTLRQLKMGTPFKRMPFTTHKVFDRKGKELGKRKIVLISSRQREAVDRLLEHLEVGGILFFNPSMYVPADVMAYKTWNEDNFDLFIMIQRTGEKTFVMYDDTPIVFRPNRDVYCPSDEMGFIDGFHKPHVDFFHHNGIKDIYDLSDPEKYDRLKLLLYRADVLAVRYQYWKKSVWGSVAFVILAIREGRSLSEIFKRYLRYVPDNGPDRLLKKQLLREARELQRSLKRKHSLLKDIARFFRPKQ